MTAAFSPPGIVAGLLAEELLELKSFVVLLNEEQALLAKGEIDSLMPLVEKKSVLTGRLTGLSMRREEEVRKGGFGAGKTGMETWLSRTNPGPAVRDQWQKLLELAAEARSLNELNGKLIGLRMQHTQQALSTLMAATDRAMTYGPDGIQRSGGGGRLFGSA